MGLSRARLGSRAVAGLVIAAVLLLGPVAGTAFAVVDGQDTDISAAPWMVALGVVGPSRDPSGYFCGGALVAPTKVVTAAHCLDDKKPAEYQVIVGRGDLREPGGETRQVVRQWTASRFPPPSGEPRFVPGGDLAVLTLDRPVSGATLALSPPNGDAQRAGTPATILGWGIYEEDGLKGPSAILQSGQTRIVDLAQCNEAAALHPVMPSQLDPRYYTCTGSPEKRGPASCGGDSGSPLVVNGRLAGVFGPIVSRHGNVCRESFSGYTRTDVYFDDLQRELGR